MSRTHKQRDDEELVAPRRGEVGQHEHRAGGGGGREAHKQRARDKRRVQRRGGRVDMEWGGEQHEGPAAQRSAGQLQRARPAAVEQEAEREARPGHNSGRYLEHDLVARELRGATLVS